MLEQDKMLARTLIEEVWNAGNFAVVEQLVSRDYVGHPSAERGVEGYKHYFVALRRAFPDIQFTVEDEIAEREKVAIRWTARGTHKGEYAGIPATGKHGVITGMTTYHIANGKVEQCWTNLDKLGLLQQLGVIPTPGQTA